MNLWKQLFNNRDYICFDPMNKGDIFSYIHPSKRCFCSQLVESFKDKVEAIIIFGSSVKNSHYPGSDLDIAIISNKKVHYLIQCIN